MRITNRNAKGSSKHNFREFDIDKAKHILNDYIDKNAYAVSNGKELFRVRLDDISKTVNSPNWDKPLNRLKESLKKDNLDNFNKLSDIEKLELYAYYSLTKKGIQSQNNRYIKKGNFDRVKDVMDYYKSIKTEPTESIIQIGNHTHKKDIRPKLLLDTYNDYLQKFDEKYGSNIKVLNWALHIDEPGAAFHVHQREVFLAHDKDGGLIVNKNKALKELGIELPNPNAKEDRHNNRLMTFTKECRELWYECCLAHGLDVDINADLENPNLHGQALIEYKQNMANEALYKALDNKEQVIKGINAMSKIYQANENLVNRAIDNGQQQLDELLNRNKDAGIIEKRTLDLMWDDNPEYVEYFQQLAEEQINNEYQIEHWKPTKKQSHTHNDDLDIEL